MRKCPHGVNVGPLDDHGVPEDKRVYSAYCDDCEAEQTRIKELHWVLDKHRTELAFVDAALRGAGFNGGNRADCIRQLQQRAERNEDESRA